MPLDGQGSSPCPLGFGDYLGSVVLHAFAYAVAFRPHVVLHMRLHCPRIGSRSVST
jgi:hypothetical protein